MFVTCDKKRVQTKTLDFGQFEIDVPTTWDKVEQQGIDSYVGQIAIDDTDTLEFDLGWYSNDLEDEPNYTIRDGQVFLTRDFSTPSRRVYTFIGNADTVDFKKLERREIEWTVIDNKNAKIVRPKKLVPGLTGVYIDSLWTNGSGIDRFNLYGMYLKPENEKLFLEAVETLRFKHK